MQGHSFCLKLGEGYSFFFFLPVGKQSQLLLQPTEVELGFSSRSGVWQYFHNWHEPLTPIWIKMWSHWRHLVVTTFVDFNALLLECKTNKKNKKNCKYLWLHCKYQPSGKGTRSPPAKCKMVGRGPHNGWRGLPLDFWSTPKFLGVLSNFCCFLIQALLLWEKVTAEEKNGEENREKWPLHHCQ